MIEEAAAPAPEAAPVDAPTEAPVEAPEASPKPPEPVPSAREAVEKAMRDEPEEKAEAKPAKPEPKADKPEAKPDANAAEKAAKPDDAPQERERNPDGTFKAKEPAEGEPVEAPEAAEPEKPAEDAGEPPSRFSPDAKAAWKDAPTPVRKETERMLRELEGGLEQYRQKFEPLKEFDSLAQKHGTTIQDALRNYVGIERLIAQDPIKGLNQVCENAGLSLRDVAAHIMGQKPEQAASQQDATIRELRSKIAELERGFGSVNQTIQQQRESATLGEVQKFAADHPRFEELSPDIAKLLQTGMAEDLPSAYEMAERLKPAPIPAQAPAAPAAPPPAAQTRKPNLSVTGAPASGSNPGQRAPSSSAREAAKRALMG